MDTYEKLRLLSDASRYDLSCACGTSSGDHRRRGGDGAWLYPVSLPGGGRTIMLKTLISNVCVNDCGYCPWRSTVDAQRCTMGPDETAKMYMEYVRGKQVFGIFLSSGVIGTPDNTMTLINDTARILREKYDYRGYIHLKVIPGSSDGAIDCALELANAVSLNIETPGAGHFKKLSLRKDYLTDIIRPMQRISELTEAGGRYSKVKKSTQFIVGASDETDAEIVKYTAGLYKKLAFNRIYFSSYQRGLGDGNIPGEKRTTSRTDESFVREHRLYQVDFLFRKYKFTESDIIFDEGGHLSLDIDPKMNWARRNVDFFPVDINRSGLNALLRVPGIGPQTASRIIKTRKEGRIKDLKSLSLGGKRLESVKKYVVL